MSNKKDTLTAFLEVLSDTQDELEIACLAGRNAFHSGDLPLSDPRNQMNLLWFL